MLAAGLHCPPCCPHLDTLGKLAADTRYRQNNGNGQQQSHVGDFKRQPAAAPGAVSLHVMFSVSLLPRLKCLFCVGSVSRISCEFTLQHHRSQKPFKQVSKAVQAACRASRPL